MLTKNQSEKLELLISSINDNSKYKGYWTQIWPTEEGWYWCSSLEEDIFPVQVCDLGGNHKWFAGGSYLNPRVNHGYLFFTTKISVPTFD